MVSMAGLFGRHVLVPRAPLDHRSPEADELQLAVNPQQLDRRPMYEPADSAFVRPMDDAAIGFDLRRHERVQ
jgi:hypothetical protein